MPPPPPPQPPPSRPQTWRRSNRSGRCSVPLGLNRSQLSFDSFSSERASFNVIDRTIALVIQVLQCKTAATAAAAAAAATRRTRAAALRSITRIRFPGSITDRIDRHRTERHDANKRRWYFSIRGNGRGDKIGST